MAQLEMTTAPVSKGNCACKRKERTRCRCTRVRWAAAKGRRMVRAREKLIRPRWRCSGMANGVRPSSRKAASVKDRVSGRVRGRSRDVAMLPTRIRAVLPPSISEKTAAMTPTGAAPSSSAPKANCGMQIRNTAKQTKASRTSR